MYFKKYMTYMCSSFFVPGVGDQIDVNELNSLATAPSCTHVQALQGYQDLDSLRAEIQQLSCRGESCTREQLTQKG
jgi:hypothetical protein